MSSSGGNDSLAFKVAIIGAGNVGSTLAYALVLNGLVGEIVLIDVDKERTEGEVMDLNHAVPLANPVRIWQGEYKDCRGADVIVISAGTAQRDGETRLDLLQRNTSIFKEIIPQVTANNDGGILLIATNPVDILSYVTWKVSGLPASRVIGSGTVLDTARFRSMLSSRLGLDARNVHAYIIGEHGDSEVPVWSLANVAGMPLDEYCRSTGCQIEEKDRQKIAKQVRNAAYEIISRKGATFYAVAVGLLRIIESILRNQNSILTVSNLVVNYYEIDDVFLSLPAVIGQNGVRNILELPLAEDEHDLLMESAELLQSNIAELEI